jgi:hypothetical protein
VIRFNYLREFQRDIAGNSIGAALGLTEGYMGDIYLFLMK